MPTKIQLRRGTAAQWTTTNTLLAEGEQGLETDTGKTKIGNGVANWNALPYAGASIGGTDTQVQFNDGGVVGGASGWTWNKTTNTMTLASGTQTESNPAQTITQTWNNAGAMFTGLRLNVTDTASNAASLLADLQVGGVSKFNIGKDGYVNTYNGWKIGGDASLLFGFSGVNKFAIGGSFNARIGVTTPNEGLGFTSGDAYNVPDVIITRDSANTLAQRNGTSAQTLRVYGTFTDAGNHRRLSLGMSTAGVAEIKPEGAGTGASGNVLHISGLPTSNPGPGILWNDAGTVKVGT